MKIEIDAKDLQKMLKTAKGLQLNKLDLDIQKSLLIKNDTLIMDNMKTQLESKFYVDVMESGETLIPEQTLKILEHFKSGLITITEDTIIHGTKELKYMPGPVDGFHTIDDEIFTYLFAITESELNHLLEVNYATSEDEVRPMLRGIEIKDNKFAALNGYYLSVREGNFNCDERIVISQEVWKVLLKTLNKKSDKIVKVSWDKDKLVKFEFEDFIIKGELYDNWRIKPEDIISTNNPINIRLETNKLLNTLKLMDKLTKEEQLVLLSANDNILEIKTKTNMNRMTDEIKIFKEGPDIKMLFNIKYLLAVINQYKDEEVNVGLKTSNNPMILQNENKLDLLLPVRLDTKAW